MSVFWPSVSQTREIQGGERYRTEATVRLEDRPGVDEAELIEQVFSAYSGQTQAIQQRKNSEIAPSMIRITSHNFQTQEQTGTLTVEWSVAQAREGTTVGDVFAPVDLGDRSNVTMTNYRFSRVRMIAAIVALVVLAASLGIIAL